MLNPAPAAPLSDQLLSCLSYLSPNEHELALIAGHPIRRDAQGVCMEDVRAAAAAAAALVLLVALLCISNHMRSNIQKKYSALTGHLQEQVYQKCLI